MTRRSKKQENVALCYRMQQMVNEANLLRNEAARKLYDVPKGYKLITRRDEILFGFALFACVVLTFGGLGLFVWCLDNDWWPGIIVFLVALGVGLMKAAAYKNRPYRVEEHVQDYYVSQVHYEALKTELKRLQTGIVDYDRQYAEQEEYIQKFKERRLDIEDYGGSMWLILKANDFHAIVKATLGLDEIDARLNFSETGYNQLLDTIEFLNQSAGRSPAF